MGFHAINRKLILELQKEKSGKEKSAKENMTYEEFEQRLNEENIPREWVSLNQNYEAPITLSGDTLHYGKHGSTRFLYGIRYDYILEKLREYKDEQDFIRSDKIAQITDIMIASSEHIREYGDVFVVTRESFDSDNDTELLKKGFKYKGYDQYMAYYTYEKVCGDEIFTGVEIGLKIKTQDFEREQYGFEDIAMCSCVTFPLPMRLKNQIIKYIRENKTKVISNEDYLFQEIINEYGFENIIEEEHKRIKFYNEAYKNILGYELERQKFLKQYSEENLLEVYRKISLGSIFTQVMSLSSRPDCIEKFRLHEAKKILKELMDKG